MIPVNPTTSERLTQPVLGERFDGEMKENWHLAILQHTGAIAAQPSEGSPLPGTVLGPLSASSGLLLTETLLGQMLVTHIASEGTETSNG